MKVISFMKTKNKEYNNYWSNNVIKVIVLVKQF